MANVDFFKVTCTEKGVLEHIKNGNIYRETIQEKDENTICFEANARFGYKVVEDASRAYPDAILHQEILMDKDCYDTKYIVTTLNGEDTLENIELEYVWRFANQEEKDEDGSIINAVSSFFRKLDKVTMLGGKYDIDWNEDKEITVTLPIGENRKARATKTGSSITIEAILEKKTTVTETWEETSGLKTKYKEWGLEGEAVPF